MKREIILGVSAVALMSTAVSAAVTGDPTSGWFVGKGDVQSAFGWNNATLQEEWASGEISFFYSTSADYDVTCEWDTVNKVQTIHHMVTSTISRDINAEINTEGRQRNQITGFNLDPAGAGTSGELPEVGDSCGDFDDVDGNANDGIITAVTPLGGGGGGGGLFVSWNGQDVLLQPAL